jgi:hypothetical protein
VTASPYARPTAFRARYICAPGATWPPNSANLRNLCASLEDVALDLSAWSSGLRCQRNNTTVLASEGLNVSAEQRRSTGRGGEGLSGRTATAP